MRTVTKNGQEFRIVEDGTWRDQWWDKVESGAWEPFTFGIMDRMLSRDTTYIDVGAWIGPTVLYASRLCRKCYALEPDPVAYKLLCDNIAANGAQNILALREAILDYDGVATFGASSLSGVLGDSGTRLERPNHRFQVKCRTLESLAGAYGMPGMPSPMFIKMDIEGAEEFALRPVEFFRGHRPTLYVSLHPDLFQDKDRALGALREVGGVYKHRYNTSFREVDVSLIRDGYVFTDTDVEAINP